ncbi:MAG: energy transducer TonB [Pseudomonadales bacterium]|nr:energy transducer TonB [Pseudomonadales bacterium]MBO6565614.1 energy transducer TonB [Pseudomonadales bacterium]MBO6594543.1 energy transducer TonB [Pseudomonadales bacterium]MBO6659038.1 energy transducer TonB [Pseudomonadales bacterium]MBO6821896.1 energy transducer TonB [Pseudomonadales bacterium]
MLHRIVLTVIVLLTSAPSDALTNEEYFAQIDRLEAEVERLAREGGPFSEHLFEPLIALAELLMSEGDFETATDTLHRAQNISHRNEGVYTPKQLSVITMLTNMALADGNYSDANRQEKFRFFVTKHHLDENDPEVLFAYADMATWYMNTGQSRRARRLLREALAMAGRMGSNPLPLAILMNKARRMEGLSSNPKELLAALESVDRSDRDTLVTAYLDVADSLLVYRKDKQAAEYFQMAAELSPVDGDSEPRPITIRRSLSELRADTERYRFDQDFFGRQRLDKMTTEEALEDQNLEPQWFLLDAEQTQRGFTIPDSHERSDPTKEMENLIGYPLVFSEEQLFNLLPFGAQRRIHTLSVEVSFTVKVNGDLADIEVVESTAPVKLNRLIMDALRRVYYRPALENGVPVERTDIRMIQTFSPTFPGV